MKYILIILTFLTATQAQNSFSINLDTKIVLNDKNVATKNAASELKRYIEKISNIEIQIINDTNIHKNIIVIGKVNDLFEQENIKQDGFILQNRDGVLTIAGSNDRAINYGVYEILQMQGCKFLSPDFEVIPKKEKISFSDFYIVDEPRFEYREIFIGESDDIPYSVKNRLNGRLGHRTKKPIPNKYGNSINIYNTFTADSLLPKDDYRCGGQVDFTSNKVKKLALKALEHKINESKLDKVTMISLARRDINSYCKSKKSMEIIEKYNSPAAPYMLYGVYLAKNLAKKFPEITFRLSAYQWSRHSPKNFIKFPTNMILSFADIEANFAKSIKDRENIEIYRDLLGWTKYIDNISIWHYIINFDGYFQPYPDLFATDKSIKVFSSVANVKGIFLQGSYGTYGGEFSNLRIWVFSKLLWNPNQDINRLIEEFAQYYYGDASQDVLEYIELLHNSLEKTDDRLLVKTSINSDYLNDKFLSEAEKLLETALLNVDDNPIYTKHVLSVISGIDYVKLVRGVYASSREKSLDRFKQFAKDRRVTSYAEGKKIGDLINFISLPKRQALVPNEAKNREWLEFQEYALKLCCTKIVRDKGASDEISAKIAGDRDEWAFQLPLDSLGVGEWEIFVDAKIKLNNNISLSDKTRFAFFYGIKGTQTKGGEFIFSLNDEKYHTIKLANIKIKKDKNYFLWIRPPDNNFVKELFIDRVFVVKNSSIR